MAPSTASRSTVLWNPRKTLRRFPLIPQDLLLETTSHTPRGRTLLGRTLKETARALSYASPNNVWALLARCVQRLRAALGANR